MARRCLSRIPSITWYPANSNRADGSSIEKTVRGSGMVKLGCPDGLVS